MSSVRYSKEEKMFYETNFVLEYYRISEPPILTTSV